MDDLSRRRFLCGAARAFLGVGLLPGALAPGRLSAAAADPAAAAVLPRKNPAQRVIYLYMAGGMSHLDTFDPKPDAGPDVRGELSAIPTSADGVRVSEFLPGIARHMHQAVVFNSLTSNQGAHDQAQYFMRTSYAKRGTIKHPHLGAWHLRFQGKINENLPGFVTVNSGSRAVGAGFFGSRFEPLAIRRPADGLQNVKHYEAVADNEFERRLDLAGKLDYDFRNRYDDRRVHAYAAMYDDAVRLMRSEDLKAFDLASEPAAVREQYGDDPFGQGCLLARRLGEHGVRFVQVELGGWDTHTENFERVADQAAKLDRGLSALLADLDSRGMLAETLVVLATEFGRTPSINQNAGRDHYPKAFSGVLFGGGVNGGQVHGATDGSGSDVVEGRLDVTDFNATIAYGLGLPIGEVLYSPTRRPFTVAHKGSPVTGIFAS